MFFSAFQNVFDIYMEIFSDKLGTELDTIGPIEYMNFVKRYRVEHQTLPVEFFLKFLPHT